MGADTISDDDDGDVPSTGPAPSDRELDRGAMIGRYLVVDAVGAGGMGVVYAAYDPELDRKVAVKLLRDETAGVASRRARLLREAQALARLDHPNVVGVFDVGTVDGDVFIAMELVAGRTVAAWLDETPRSWREVVDVFQQAGRGLAAAHALGIVHRDFKPENALIDERGRVRVVDFGLAATESTDDGDDAAPRTIAPLGPDLTQTGALLGTPGYIAPEQHAGATQPSVDQFSFCVALWRGLHGQLPFAGTSAAELAAAAAAGTLREPVRRVPAWLQRIVRRGLAPDPAARFPSMDALLAELGRDRARRRYLLAAGIALPAIALGVVALAPRSPSICRGADRELAGAWDQPAITRAFAATGVPYAGVASVSASGLLARYQSSWVAMRTEACEATHVRGEQSAHLLDLRMACLDARAAGLRALGELFAHADAKVVEKAIDAATALRPVADCADTAALEAPIEPPATPVLRLRVQALRDQLAAARVLLTAGKFDDGIARATPVVVEGRGLGYRPIEAEALRTLGELQLRADELAPARTTLEHAVTASIAARDDGTAEEAASLLVMVVGYDLGKPEEAEPWIRLAEAFLEAEPHDGRRAALDNNIGAVRTEASRYDEAIDYHNRALALRRQMSGGDSSSSAMMLDNLGNDYEMKGDATRAAQYHQQALDIETALFGPSHPRVGLTLTNLGGSLMDIGRLDEALAAEQKALVIKEASYGKDSAMVGASLHEIGNIYFLQGDFANAAANYQRVVDIYRRALGPDHPRLGNATHSLGNALRHLHRLDEAEALYRESLAIRQKAFGPDHPDVAKSISGLGSIALDRGHYDEALARFQNAEKIVEAKVPDSDLLAVCLGDIGDAQLGAGRFAPAADAYTRALAIRDANKDSDPVERAATRLGLAQATWPTDRAKARALAETAAELVRGGTTPSAAEQRHKIEAWLAQAR